MLSVRVFLVQYCGMRYLLAYMIEGEARDHHLELSDRLAEQFKLAPVSSRIGPHLTLKEPFETDDPADVIETVRAFARKEAEEPLLLGGFNDFDERVIYMDVDAPKQTHMLVRRLQDQLRRVPWLPFSRKEFPIVLHATLCYPKNLQHAKEILSYLSDEKPKVFDLSLDHIALMVRGEERWETVERFRLK